MRGFFFDGIIGGVDGIEKGAVGGELPVEVNGNHADDEHGCHADDVGVFVGGIEELLQDDECCAAHKGGGGRRARCR